MAQSRQRVKGVRASDGAGHRVKRRRGFFARIWKPVFGTLAVLILAGFGFLAWAYNHYEVPDSPDEIALAQTSTVYFADGKTKMGTFSEVNRDIVQPDEINDTVKHAVVASEDETFYENRGISVRGIFRAFVNNLSGGSRQGGSTITQQYVENYYSGSGSNTTYVSKFREAILAIKIDQETSKDEILSNYLNTIYFGRGAYGIQAAAQTYFGKDAKDLNDAESALLVGIIPAPSAWDPANNADKAQARFDRTLNKEVELGFLTQAERDKITTIPETQEKKTTDNLGGTNGYLLAYAKKELVASGEYTEDDIDRGGLTITTTINQTFQQDTVDAIANMPEDRPANNRIGTMTVDPSTGAIVAMYGGPDYLKQYTNDAIDSHMQAGSIFKTFTLVAAITDGYSLHSYWPGNSGETIGGWTVNNFDDENYGSSISLLEATQHSVNTAYASLNRDMGPDKTLEMAKTLGLPENTPGLDGDITNVLGTASPSVQNMVAAYATIDNGGKYNSTYIVGEVKDSDGEVEYTHKSENKQVIDEDIATNATVALEQPVNGGTAKKVGQQFGRPAAGKTGTSDGPKSAWLVGFTPQYVTGVGMFQPSEDGKSEEVLTKFGGYSSMTGSSVPTDVWLDIMTPIHEGLEEEDFKSAVSIGSKEGTEEEETTPSTTQAPTTTEEPTTSETPTETETTPTETESPTETETPTETESPTETETTPTEEAPDPDDGDDDDDSNDPNQPANSNPGDTTNGLVSSGTRSWPSWGDTSWWSSGN